MNVDNNVARVFNGFLELTQDQKTKFYGMIADFRTGTDHTRRELRESVYGSVTKMQTGPHNDNCPCCGR
jgi:hypothetical protein